MTDQYFKRLLEGYSIPPTGPISRAKLREVLEQCERNEDRLDSVIDSMQVELQELKKENFELKHKTQWRNDI